MLMRITRRLGVALVFIALAAPLQAQAPGGLTADLLQDITMAESKLVALGEVMTDAHYDWRPGAGVRSVREVLLHIAADNYFLPTVLGVAAPAATKITATDFAPVQAFEKQQLDRAASIAELKASFGHLKAALARVPDSRMNEKLSVFGQEFTVRGFLILTATHLHEHLGQLIAYARSNGVTPPWSQ